MNVEAQGIPERTRRRGLGLLAALFCAGLLTACEEPVPRNFADFMEDRIAREGTLARCNANREATLNDIECANARRAAAAIALRRERERREAFERESEFKLAALRDQVAERDREAREAAARAIAAEEAAYEALWNAEGNRASVLEPITLPAAARRVPVRGSTGPALEEFSVAPRPVR